MGRRFQDREHLIRMAGVFAAGVVVFLVARALLVPDGFGALGHFRRGALDDERAHVASFAGSTACLECHDDVAAARKGSKHLRVHCEACHGPLARHAADPTEVTPAKLEAARLCLTCHVANVAKPATFPQVDPADHGEGEACTECHLPHHPEIS